MKKSVLITVLVLCLVICLTGCFGGDDLLDECTITLAVNPEGWGSVIGGGKILKGTDTTVTAQAKSGYAFKSWTEGTREVSTNASYTFRVTKDRTLVANFIVEESTDEYTITLSANPAAGGTVSGGGIFEKDALITVTAQANEGYVFECWREGEQEVCSDAAYEFLVTMDRNLVAEFKISDTPGRPEYNAHDCEKLRAFLEFEHEGVKNGERISTDYNPQDPTTWPALTWTEGEELRIKKIEWLSLGLYGPLDLSACEALETLYIYSNHITALDVSGCTALETLWCEYNRLTELDAGGCTALNSLKCSLNQDIVDINVSGCSALETFHCAANKLTGLDVSDCYALKDLACGNNELGELDVSSCPLLVKVWCEHNHLTTLNLRGCEALEELSCGDNRLTALDLSDCLVLEFLSCSVNELEILDVGGFAALKQIYCTNNKLTDLQLDGCNALQRLNCSYNLLTFSKLPIPGSITNYEYKPQDLIPIGNEGKIKVNEEIDFSDEVEFDGIKTVFTWYEKGGGEVNPTLIREGVFYFGDRYLASTLYCKMTNAKYPGLDLYTVEVQVVSPED